ncbi:MAG: NPCBM/NEW2 domain-containing protein [Gemmatimonadaceae bacterium]
MDRRSFLIAGTLATTAKAFKLPLADQPSVVRLSTLRPRLANHGWGSQFYDVSVDGKPLQIGERVYAHGVSTHARSDLVYLLGGRHARFRAWVGVDATKQRAPEATAVFYVFVDGKKAFDSGVMSQSSAPQRVDIPVTGANHLRLVVGYVDTYCDHVNWAEAELVRSPLARDIVAADGGPILRIPSGSLAFHGRGHRITTLELPSGQRLPLAVSGGLAPGALQRAPRDGVTTYHPIADGIRWNWEYRSPSQSSWTSPVDTVFQVPDPSRMRLWLPWGHGWQWEDPLAPRPFEDKTYEYGAFFNREGGLSLPMATILDPVAGVGVSFIQSPDDVLLDMQVTTTSAGEIRFSRAFHRFGGGAAPTQFNVDIVVHEPDVRAALRAIVDRYPKYFNAPNPLAHRIGGGAAYSGWEGDLPTEKLTAMGFTFNWKASLDFPYMGLFLPPVADDVQWNRFAGGGDGRHTDADEGRYGQTTIRHMNDYSVDMKRRGFHVLNYFNVTEFGTNIVYPPPPPATTNPAERWRNSNDLLHGQLEGAVLKTPDPIFTWGKGVIMDCGEANYRRLLLDQARQHVARLPDSDGICIDRMDWLTRYNPHASDNVTWIDGPNRHLRRSWMSLMSDLAPIFHQAGKVVFGNDMDRRLELMEHVDGFYDEHGHFPFNLNTSAWLSVRKPLVCWTPDDDALKPDPDVYFQRLLYLGAFPTIPYAGNDHTLVPNDFNEPLYLAYGPLFRAIMARTWILQPGIVDVDGGVAKANAFETPTKYVVFVGLAGERQSVSITVRGLEGEGTVLHPGSSAPVPLKGIGSTNSVRWDVPMHRGCALLLLPRT